ncbi:hypothetical protein N0M98_21590 [Paenibacillus doosanensis]|uniref:hypothetical protein n=1 Tax=Paenibacillus TaxID=44249 RepID=UPI00201E2D6D|nr:MULTISPECIES: hypothetical protein [Paenibacillus]MCS7462720.1 hypothetical protein [Paenibacillus doosanensis]
MNLTPEQRLILMALTAEWQAPVQIAKRLPQTSGNVDVQQVLKDLLREGWVQMNPAVPGLYRLTSQGITVKTAELE